MDWWINGSIGRRIAGKMDCCIKELKDRINYWIAGLWDCQIGGLIGQWIGRSADGRIDTLLDWGIKKKTDQRINVYRLTDQFIAGSLDWLINGSTDQHINGFRDRQVAGLY